MEHAKVLYMYAMFNASSFNQDVSSWNTAKVMDMNSMFLHASSFNQDISSWNTAAVTRTDSMFNNVVFAQPGHLLVEHGKAGRICTTCSCMRHHSTRTSPRGTRRR